MLWRSLNLMQSVRNMAVNSHPEVHLDAPMVTFGVGFFGNLTQRYLGLGREFSLRVKR